MSEKVFRIKKGTGIQNFFKISDEIVDFILTKTQHNSRFFWSGKNGHGWIDKFVRGCRIQIKITETKKQAGEKVMKCKNCGHPIRKIRKGSKGGSKLTYKGYRHWTLNLTSYNGATSLRCFKECGCIKPEPEQAKKQAGE